MPTFGYTTIGGTTADLEGTYITDLNSISENGDVTSISSYLNIVTASHRVVNGVYNSSRNLVTNGQSNETNFATGASWRTNSYTTSPSLTTGSYSLLTTTEAISGTCVFYYDSAGATDVSYVGRVYDSNVPASISAYGYALNVSIYATYTASGGTVVKDFIQAGFIAFPR